jgi:hypothetical protein
LDCGIVADDTGGSGYQFDSLRLPNKITPNQKEALSGAIKEIKQIKHRFRVCRMHGARGGAPEGERNGNYRHGTRSKENIALWKLIKAMK